MVATPQSKVLPFLAGALVIAALVGGGVVLYWSGHAAGEAGERKTWQAKWNEETARQAIARARAEQKAREEDSRRQAEIDEVRDHAQEEIARAQDDAAAAGLESGRLREQARRLAARASQCASNSGATQGSPAAEQPAVVLADLLSRADERAGELAAAYDRARASGLACERAYDSLRTETMKPRP
ncbi:DUF2514 domain-containing protein [Aeromonas enteropelogenes]|uniref:DUF2514 domain-containing protein n=1 Tax=Aeromonas enteropelogenes TaxID=29489 RepID=UPI002286A97A|nr:DUF2514 domain-containing protein [Aeromonas enteropelogenes]MCZ0752572.1 DUF2514 domain-containing protein [Aeromonas enteropelogenes]